MHADIAYKYNLTVAEIISFFNNGSLFGFSIEEIETMEAKYNCVLPRAYREYLITYGACEMNQKHNVLFPPNEISTSYDELELCLEESKEEFDYLVQKNQKHEYEDTPYFHLYQTPKNLWHTITENYLIIWCENQGIWYAGYLLKDLQSGVEDPPIYINDDEDFISFSKSFNTTEEFLMSMLFEATSSYSSLHFTERQEIDYILSKKNIEISKLGKSYTNLSDNKYCMGTALDESNDILYSYYEYIDYFRLDITDRSKDGVQIEFEKPVETPVYSPPIPHKLILSEESQRYMPKKIPEHAIAINPFVAEIIKKNLGNPISCPYDLTKIKTFSLVIYDLPHNMVKTREETIVLKTLGKIPSSFYYCENSWDIFGKMPNLEELTLVGIYVDDFSFLQHCKKLKSLHLCATNFSDCSLLVHLDESAYLGLPKHGLQNEHLLKLTKKVYTENFLYFNLRYEI